ncbi:hypothetical protein NDU88_006966 [Pleurodeles waltl]|uniref:Uncharacterized protein n=1 Tax=Pleurodeles waltl TaxID=8319 RepID=A0AAV7N0U6_PLEWA|nr:hypothetical protein NDU88_006966 [Pleurodeles waltl]
MLRKKRVTRGQGGELYHEHVFYTVEKLLGVLSSRAHRKGRSTISSIRKSGTARSRGFQASGVQAAGCGWRGDLLRQ